MPKNQHAQMKLFQNNPAINLMVRQKLGMVLENKVVQKLKLEKKVFYKKWSPKLIFLIDFFLKKFSQFLIQKIDFESTISALFDKP